MGPSMSVCLVFHHIVAIGLGSHCYNNDLGYNCCLYTIVAFVITFVALLTSSLVMWREEHICRFAFKHYHGLCCAFIMRSLHEVHSKNTLCSGRVCPHDSTRGPLDGLGWNLVCVLCHSVLSHNRTFWYRTDSDNRITDEKIREMDDNRLGEVLHSGGQVGTIEVRICLFTIIIMVTKGRLARLKVFRRKL
jgi:hypothetical protein